MPESTDLPELEYRKAEFAEASQILHFWQVAAEDAHRPSDSLVAVESLIRRDADALMLVVASGQIVGSLISGWDGWRCHLYRLAVHPQWRRRGIAQRLVERAESRFEKLGAVRVDAMVLHDNLDAHAFWTAAGYSQQAEWRRWVKPIG